MIDNNDDSLSDFERCQKSQSFDNQQDIDIIRYSEDSNAMSSQIKAVANINNNSNFIPENSNISLHNGLSSPVFNDSINIEPQKINGNNIIKHKEDNNNNGSILVQQQRVNHSNEIIKQEEDQFESIMLHETKQQLKNIENTSAFVELNPKEEMISDDEQVNIIRKDKINIIKLYENILDSNLSQISQPFYIITVKDKVKDMLIGFHIVYEISLYQIHGIEKETKCYRRYDNFAKLYKKLRSKYPYIMIPKLTPKKYIAKITTFDDEFYENRRFQLIFFLNFIANHHIILKTKELNKFLNDANFDEAYFSINDSSIYSLSFNSTPSELIKTKITSLWNSLGSSGSSRKLNDNEILINKMTIHYKNICKKYSEIKLGICKYITTIKEDAIDYKSLSEALYYIKDSFDYVEGSPEKLNDYSKFSLKISLANQTNHPLANKLQNKLQALISLLEGICYSFKKYSYFIKEYYNIITSKLISAKEKSWDNINDIVAKYDQCDILKNIFDRNLSQEANDYIELFDDSTVNVLEEFKTLLMNINKNIL